MKSLDYLEEIMSEHCLSKKDMMDIIEKLSYIARDNNMSDEVLEELLDTLSE